MFHRFALLLALMPLAALRADELPPEPSRASDRIASIRVG